MTAEQFIALWKDNKLTERGGAQAHFDDLCELLGVEKPRDPDNYCFERGAKKASSGNGWADVWKRGHFGWENKKPGRDLNAALKQLTDYALQLENPPLLVVCDRERIVIHTAFTGYPDEPREIRIEQLVEPEVRQLLKWVFSDPEKLRPEKSTAAITAQAAGQFAQLAAAMRSRGEAGQKVAHFLVQCLFCMFAEDEALLPIGIFTDLLKNAGSDVDKAAHRIEKLFTAMQKKGGDYGDHDIAWFNGGLFSTRDTAPGAAGAGGIKNIDIPPLTVTDLQALHRAAADMDWRAIDPTIFGTLFERGLDPAARAPLGAHYTDTGTIAKLIDPLVSEPLAGEWAKTKAEMAAKPKKAKAAYQTFLLRLNRYRVLDPACGSGNFLYLALIALRNIEKRAHVEAQEFGLQPPMNMETGPHNILGLEINEFAAELARVTVWIGDIQWCRRNGYPHAINPILKPLDGIEHRDALLTFSPRPATGEQPCPKSSLFWVPCCIIFQHCIHDSQELSHTSDDHHFGWFSGLFQAIRKGLNRIVAPHSRDGRHIQHRPYIGPPTPNEALTPMFATVVRQWRHARQRRNLATIERPQFWTLRQHRQTGHCAYARDGAQQIVLGTPDIRFAQPLVQITINFNNLFVQPGNVFFQTFL